MRRDDDIGEKFKTSVKRWRADRGESLVLWLSRAATLMVQVGALNRNISGSTPYRWREQVERADMTGGRHEQIRRLLNEAGVCVAAVYKGLTGATSTVLRIVPAQARSTAASVVAPLPTRIHYTRKEDWTTVPVQPDCT